MNPEIKAQWIQALRSGLYPQAFKYLRTEEGYCCLGVLTDLYAQATQTPWEKRCDAACWIIEGEVTSACSLPHAVKEWAGLNKRVPAIPCPPTGEVSLVDLNDGAKLTFHQIADLIEKHL